MGDAEIAKGFPLPARRRRSDDSDTSVNDAMPRVDSGVTRSGAT